MNRFARLGLFCHFALASLTLHACTVIPTPLAPNVDDDGKPIGGDTLPPEIAITAPAQGAAVVIGQALLVEGSASDNVGVATVTASLDGTSRSFSINGTVTWSFVVDTSVLTPGPITVIVRATDSAGNSTEASLSLTVMNSPADPVAVLTGLPSNPTKDTSVNVTVSGENVTQYQYRVDSNSFSSAQQINEPIVIAGLADGSHTLEVLGGNAENEFQPAATPTSFAWTIDATAPVLSLSAVPADPTRAASSDYTASVSPSELVTFDYTVTPVGTGCSDSTASTSGVDTTTISVDHTVCNGLYTLSVTATDALGNVSAPTVRTFTVDRAAPVFTLTPASPTSPTNAASTTFTATTTPSETATFNYTVTYANCTGNNVTSSASGTSASIVVNNSFCNGQVTLAVTTTDALGNVSSALSRSYVVDAAAPSFSLTPVSPTSPTNAGQTTFTATTSPSETATFAYSIVYTNCTASNTSGTVVGTSGSINVSNSPCDGNVTLSVTATDATGNTSSAVSRSYTVDRTAPTFTLTPASPTSPTNAASTDFAATTAPSETATFAYTVAYANCAASNTSGSLSGTSATITASNTPCDGLVTLSVTAADALGNVSSALSRTYTVDRSGPTFTVTPVTPTDPSVTDNQAFTATTTPSETATFNYTVAYTNCSAANTSASSSGTSLGVLVDHTPCDGVVTLSITATDALGNTSAAVTRSYSVIRTGPPFTLLPNPPPNPTNAASTTFTATTTPTQTVTFDYTVVYANCAGSNDAGSDVGVSTTTIVLNNACNGLVTLSVSATDGLGNTAGPVVRSYVIDTVAPTFDLTPLQASVVSPTNAATTVFTATTNPSESLDFSWTITRPVGGSCSNTNGSATGVTTTGINVDNTGCDGSYSVAVTATDAVGNATTVTRSYTVDRTAPAFDLTPLQAALTSPTNAATTVFTATTNPSEVLNFSWTITRPVGGSCSNTSDNAAGVASTGITVNNVGCDGAYSVSVTATDAAGNTASATRTYTVDRTAPACDLTPLQAALTSPTNAASTVFTATTNPSETLDFSWIIARTGAGCSNTSGSATGVTFTGITVDNAVCDGTYRVDVTATDTAGNTYVDTRTYSVDRTADFTLTPDPAVDSSAASTTFTATSSPTETLDYAWTITRTGSGCSDSSGSGSGTSTSIVVSHDVCDGAYTLEVIATDAVGNTSTHSRSYNVTYAASFGTAEMLGGPDSSPTNPTRFTTAEFVVHRLTGGSTHVMSRVDGVAGSHELLTNGFSRIRASALSAGSHTVEACLSDGVTPQPNCTSRTFTVALTDPSAPVITPPTSPTNALEISASVTFPVSSTLTYQLTNGVTVAAEGSGLTSGALSFGGLGDGTYTLTATAVDRSGRSSTPTVAIFDVDRRRPDFSMTGLPDRYTADATLNVTVTSVDGADYRYSLDYAAFSATTPTTTPITDALTATGWHSLRVQMTDAAGNVGEDEYWFLKPTTNLWVDGLSGTDSPNNCQTPATPCATIDYALTQASGATAIHLADTTTYAPTAAIHGANITLVGGWDSGFLGFGTSSYSTVDDSNVFTCIDGESVGLIQIHVQHTTSNTAPLFDGTSACDFAIATDSQFTGLGLFNVVYLDGAKQAHVDNTIFGGGVQALLVNPSLTSGRPTRITRNTFSGHAYPLVLTLNRDTADHPVILALNYFVATEAAISIENREDGDNSPVLVLRNTVDAGREGVAIYQAAGSPGVGPQVQIERNTLGGGTTPLRPNATNSKATGVRFNNEVAATDAVIEVRNNTISLDGSNDQADCVIRGVAEATHVQSNTITVGTLTPTQCVTSRAIVGIDDSDTPPNFATTTALKSAAFNTVSLGEGIGIRTTVSEAIIAGNSVSISGLTGEAVSGVQHVLVGNYFGVRTCFGALASIPTALHLRNNFLGCYSPGSLPGGTTVDLDITNNYFSSAGTDLLSVGPLRNLIFERNTMIDTGLAISLTGSGTGAVRVLNNQVRGASSAVTIERSNATGSTTVVINGNLLTGNPAVKSIATFSQPITQFVNNTVIGETGMDLALTNVLLAANNIFHNPSGPGSTAVLFSSTQHDFFGFANTFSGYTSVLLGSTGDFPDCADTSFCTAAELVTSQEGISTIAPVFVGPSDFQLASGTDCVIASEGTQVESVAPSTQAPLEIRSQDTFLQDRTLDSSAECAGGISRGFHEY